MLKSLTKNYVEAFNNKNIEQISKLFLDDFVLEDPVVNRIIGKKNSLEAIKAIFASCRNLSFEAKSVYQDNQTTILEFILKLDNTTLIGVDIIEWENNKMKELRAYLDIPCGDN